MKPRILSLVKLPPPHTGAAVMNALAVKALGESFDVVVLDLSYNQEVAQLGDLSIKKFFKSLKNYVKLIRLLSKKSFNVSYFQISPIGIPFLRDSIYAGILRLFSVKVVYHLHGQGIKKQSESFLFRNVYRWVFSGQEVICLSDKLVEDIEDVYERRPFILPNCIDGQLIKEIQSGIKRFDFIFLSNLIINKGLRVFIDALSRIIREYPDVKVAIVGGEYDWTEDTLKQELALKGLSSNCEYLGSLYGKEKFNVLRVSKVLVFPSLNDVWGLVILEAFSQGVPVIGSDVGAVSDMVIQDVTGSLVEPANVDQLTLAMTNALMNPEEWVLMGHTAQQLVAENYSIELFEKKIISVLHAATEVN